MSRLLIAIGVVALLIGSCTNADDATAEDTEVTSPTSVEVLEPDVSTDVPATSFEEIVGAYEKPAGEFGFLEIATDGTIVFAADRNDPSQITLTARIDGETVVIKDPDCGQDLEGRYEFLIVEDGGIDVVLVDDSCPGRAGLIPGHYDPLG